MKTIRTFLILTACVFISHQVFSQGIIFTEGDWATIKAKAKQENKMIFADCYTTWCGPCKWMDKNVFHNDTVGAFYNSNFICVSIDMEKGEGKEISKLYEVGCYPTYIYTDVNGNLLHRESGAFPVKKFVEAGKKALTPEQRYSYYKEKFDAGDISKKELLTYIQLRNGSCLGISEQKLQFFNMKSEEGDTLVWFFIKNYGIDIHSKEYESIISSREEYNKKYSEETVNRVILNTYLSAFDKCLYNNVGMDTAQYIKLKAELQGLNIPDAKTIISDFDIALYLNTQNWKQLVIAAKEYVSNLAKDETEFSNLNNIAWVFYENINNDEDLKIALGWAKRSVELNPKYFNTDTYAALLYKLGNKKEAVKVANEAIELAKKEGADYSGTAILLEEIKKLK